MLLYGKMVKLAELELADYGPPPKMVLALKFEPLDQTRPNFRFSKEKIFLTSAEKDNLVQHHLGCKKWQKHGAHFAPNGLYHGSIWRLVTNSTGDCANRIV